MDLRRLAATAAAALVPVVVGATVSPAVAASHVHVDPTGDTVRSTTSGSDQPDPGFKAADITKLGLIYAGKDLRITTTLRALAVEDWSVFAEITTPQTTGKINFFVFDEYDDHGRQDVSLRLGSGHISCDGLQATTARSRHTVTIDVPRDCIGAPTSVRVGVDVEVRTTVAGKVVYHDDDAQKRGDFKKLTLSPAIKHD